MYVVLLIGTILAVMATLFVVLAVLSDGPRERRWRVAMYALGSAAMLGVVAILIACDSLSLLSVEPSAATGIRTVATSAETNGEATGATTRAIAPGWN